MGKQGFSTMWLLMAQYEGRAMIPAELVCQDFFPPMTLQVFLRKINDGEIPLPLVRMTSSQKGAKMVHLKDLAEYIDKAAEAARKEAKALAK
ncbi:pyocin activator PrtN family protein [Thioclava litoralis]|uniref:Pyocin activator PrtN family protein n=1 Tax=Thioclava litoralis TaxID=3076557 RepID=A0ABZ1E142_9RHOB|nr:pyocin activator PrtN family protein [Thioclava sp. FTW29]